MNISTKLNDEQIDPDKPSKGYEWWYFDALSVDKQWGIVIIFYHGNPFSPEYIGKEDALPDEFPAISVSVYHKSKAEYYSFLEYGEGKFKWDDEEQTGSIGSNIFKRRELDGEIEYELILTQNLESGHSINAKLKFISTETDPELIERTSEGEQHFWNLIQAQAKVSGSIKLKGKRNQHVVAFNGTGYHDHNTGYEPMKDSFEDWYWGRFHFKESTLIYYVMNRLDGSQQYESWLISKDGSHIVDTFSSTELKHAQKSKFGLSVARKIELNSNNSNVVIQQSTLIDNGPFYQRYLSEAIMLNNDTTSAATGFSEYIKPANIYDEKYWWMVRMRLRFKTEKAHWVQRYKFLYEKTW